MSKVKKIKKCRICHSRKLYRFLDLGSMPIPNGFLRKEQLEQQEDYFELACFYCKECGLVQLTNVIDPNLMFKNYAYLTSQSRVMQNNFMTLVNEVNSIRKLNDNVLAVDIGSNDGTLLTLFKGYGAKVLGIDPAENLSLIAKMKGIPAETKLFNRRTAKYITKKYGRADVITATNVIAHIDNLHQVMQGVFDLLKRDGVFVTEFPYLLDLMQKKEFDTIYHEHLSYFPLKPWKMLIERYGFEIIEVQRLQIHGGSIRIFHKRKKTKKPRERKQVQYLISLEGYRGLYNTDSYEKFSEGVVGLKEELKTLLLALKKQKKKIVGYGAAAKGNVLTNFFDIGTDILDYIVDSTPFKQGLYTPGKHIPIYPEQKILEDMPDYALILAWNFADEIIEKNKLFQKRGGKFIIPIPEVKIV